MFQEYLHALVFMIIIAGFSVIFILLSRLLTLFNNKYSKIAKENYESGFSMLSDTDQRFSVPYFRPALFSVIMVLFLLLLFPLSLIFSSFPVLSLFLIFILMCLGIGSFIYAIKKGLLSW